MGKGPVRYDWIVAVALTVISTFGLFVLLTINQDLFRQQLVYIGIGALALVGLSRVDRIVLRWFAPYAYIIGVLSLIVTYLTPAIRGSHRWIVIGSQQLQTSELAKPLFLLAFSYLIDRFPPRNPRYLPLHLVAFFIPFILVFKQPDFGTSLIYLGFWFFMMIAGGLSIRVLGLLAAGIFLVAPFVYQGLAPYQKERITTFLNPAFDPKGAGYNALQSTIAVGSGQLFGRGLGLGTQSHMRFLPEYHTDFIFATLVEELGFAGGLTLIVGYGVLLWRMIIFIWRSTKDLFVYAFSSGIFAMILTQMFINTGMNMGILPVTGITLPLVSYGGSSILSLGLSFGIFFALQARRHEAGDIAIT